MYISYSSSDAYAPHTTISIISLLENNKDVDDIVIFLLDLGISEENKSIIQDTIGKYHRSIHFIRIKDDAIIKYLGKDIPKHIGSYATYARICAPIVYPEYVDRIICIDSDMIIAGSLSGVYNMNMEGKIVGAVPIRYKDYKTLAGSSKEEQDILSMHKHYINNGFLMFNLENWKRFDFARNIKKAVSELSIFKHKDQTILNFALDDYFLLTLPPTYNNWLHKLPKYTLASEGMEPFTKAEVNEAMKKPVVVHYVGEYFRPWYKENISTMAGYYYKYKKISAYVNTPLQSLFNSNEYKNRSLLENIFIRLYLMVYHNPVFGRLFSALKYSMSKFKYR